jgi:hypothetical protein
VETNERGNDMPVGEKSWKPGQPRLDRSLTLRFIGDWGAGEFSSDMFLAVGARRYYSDAGYLSWGFFPVARESVRALHRLA